MVRTLLTANASSPVNWSSKPTGVPSMIGSPAGSGSRARLTSASTFRMAPLSQLLAGDSRKVIVLARSRVVPTRPSGWKPSKLWSVSSSLSAR
jgi:hypothetical protein